MERSWKPTKLGNVLTQISRSERVDRAKEYRLLGVRLEGGGAFHRETKRGSELSATTLRKVESGDFIYSRLFAWRGAFGVIGSDLHGSYVSNEFPTFRPVEDRIDVEFLRLWFRLPAVIRKVEADCSGSTPQTRNRFKEPFFLATKIPLPPLPEQRLMVARIEELAARIEEARGVRQQAVAEVDAFMSSWHIHSSSSQPTELGNVLELDEHKEAVRIGHEYPQVGVKGFGRGLFEKEAVEGSRTTYKAFNRLYEGALVLSQVKGWEGALAVCPPSLAGRYVSPEYRTFRCISGKALPAYMSALVSTPWFWGQLKSLTRGVGARRERTRPEQFLRMKLVMPDVKRQRQALSFIAGLERVRSMQAETAVELDALLPSVLDKAFKEVLDCGMR